MKIRDSLASWTHTEEVNAALLTFLSDKAVKAKRERRKELRIRTNSAGLRARRPLRDIRETVRSLESNAPVFSL
jgi:hypothetical protein